MGKYNQKTDAEHSQITPLLNNDKLKVIQADFSMQTDQTKYDCVEFEDGGMKVTLEFPKVAENEVELAKEIKSILSGELRDYIQRYA